MSERLVIRDRRHLAEWLGRYREAVIATEAGIVRGDVGVCPTVEVERLNLLVEADYSALTSDEVKRITPMEGE